MNSIPIIDYFSHPAFANISVERDEGTELAAEMQAIDEVFLGSPNGETFQRETASHWDRMADIARESVKSEMVRTQTELAVHKACETMTAYCRWKSKPTKATSKRHRTSETVSILEQLHDRGCAVTDFPAAVRDQLIGMLSEQMEQVEERHKLCPIDRCSLHMPTKGDAFDLAWKTLRSMGLTAALHDLFGRPVEPMYWYLAHNTASEAWYKDCYADAGLPTSQFAYGHFDHDFELAKIQIYFTEVGPENGPFTFVPGSHVWSGCKTQQYMFKEMDKTLRYPRNDSLYYRPRFQNEESRREFLELPVPLHGTSHFGDDVVEGSELSNELAQSFHAVTSDVGNCCVFAGGDLLHYGGIVSGAERWVLQVGVATQRPHSAGPAPKQTLLRKLASTGRRYVGDKPIDAVRRILGYTDDPVKQAGYTVTTPKEKEPSVN